MTRVVPASAVSRGSSKSMTVQFNLELLWKCKLAQQELEVVAVVVVVVVA